MKAKQSSDLSRRLESHDRDFDRLKRIRTIGVPTQPMSVMTRSSTHANKNNVPPAERILIGAIPDANLLRGRNRPEAKNWIENAK